MAAFAVSGAGAQQPSGKVLVAYFSHSGNTREVARQISEATGGDLFEIVPATPYPTEYRAVVDQGKKEIEAGVRPALKNPVGDLSQYDVIFVGSPCWWATIAPPVATFLTSCDLAGKTVVPFMTRGAKIINVSSIAAFCPTPRMTVYSASKAYVSAFTGGIADELRPKGISVTAVCPGPMKTEFFDAAGDHDLFGNIPWCDPVKVVAGTIRAAKKGRTFYTPTAFNKFYRFVAKLLPMKWMLKATRV